MKEWTEKIQALIDKFPDEHYVELLQEMIYMAKTSLDARLEETGKDDE